MWQKNGSEEFRKVRDSDSDESIPQCLGYVVITLAMSAFLASSLMNSFEHYTLQGKIMSGVGAVAMALAGLKYLLVIARKILSR